MALGQSSTSLTTLVRPVQKLELANSPLLANCRQVFSVCPVIDREFRSNIVKIAVDQGGDSRVDPQTTLTMP